MREKKKTGYTVTLNDMRGEYWLYTEGGISVNVGRGMKDAYHFNTSDMHQQTGPAIGNGQAAVILARVMARFAGEQGGRLVLHLDGKYELSEEDLAVIDKELAKSGFASGRAAGDKEPFWTG